MDAERRPLRLLVIEDDPDDVFLIRELVSSLPSGVGFELASAGTLKEGLERLASGAFDVILLDLVLPDSKGMETFLTLRERRPEAAVVILTGVKDERLAMRAMSEGAQDYLVKGGFDVRSLGRALGYAVERKQLLARVEGIIRNSADGMVVVGPDRTVLLANPAAERLFERDAASMVGRPFEHSLSPGETREVGIRLSDGSVRWAEIRVTDTTWGAGPALLASIRDITELKRLEQLKAEVRERRKIDKLKDEFINAVSHELRTPLTIVRVTVDNLRDGLIGGLDEAQRQAVEVVHKSVMRLAKLINNLLDLSRLESGKARMNKREVEAGPLVSEAVEACRAAHPGSRTRIEVDLPPDAPTLYVDPDLAAQVLGNLLDNAMRFARSKVVVRVRPAVIDCDPDSEGPGDRLTQVRAVRISVIDDGPGMPKEAMGELFNKFVQFRRPAGGGGYKGTGLGLAICKQITEQHEGRIWVESMLGKGAQFHWAVPQYPRRPGGERRG